MEWLPKATRNDDSFLLGSSITKSNLIYDPPVQKLKRHFKNIVHLINANDILFNLVTSVCLCASRDKNFLLKFNG